MHQMNNFRISNQTCKKKKKTQ